MSSTSSSSTQSANSNNKEEEKEGTQTAKRAKWTNGSETLPPSEEHTTDEHPRCRVQRLFVGADVFEAMREYDELDIERGVAFDPSRYDHDEKKPLITARITTKDADADDDDKSRQIVECLAKNPSLTHWTHSGMEIELHKIHKLTHLTRLELVEALFFSLFSGKVINESRLPAGLVEADLSWFAVQAFDFSHHRSLQELYLHIPEAPLLQDEAYFRKLTASVFDKLLQVVALPSLVNLVIRSSNEPETSRVTWPQTLSDAINQRDSDAPLAIGVGANVDFVSDVLPTNVCALTVATLRQLNMALTDANLMKSLRAICLAGAMTRPEDTTPFECDTQEQASAAAREDAKIWYGYSPPTILETLRLDLSVGIVPRVALSPSLKEVRLYGVALRDVDIATAFAQMPLLRVLILREATPATVVALLTSRSLASLQLQEKMSAAGTGQRDIYPWETVITPVDCEAIQGALRRNESLIDHIIFEDEQSDAQAELIRMRNARRVHDWARIAFAIAVYRATERSSLRAIRDSLLHVMPLVMSFFGSYKHHSLIELLEYTPDLRPLAFSSSA